MTMPIAAYYNNMRQQRDAAAATTEIRRPNAPSDFSPPRWMSVKGGEGISGVDDRSNGTKERMLSMPSSTTNASNSLTTIANCYDDDSSKKVETGATSDHYGGRIIGGIVGRTDFDLAGWTRGYYDHHNNAQKPRRACYGRPASNPSRYPSSTSASLSSFSSRFGPSVTGTIRASRSDGPTQIQTQQQQHQRQRLAQQQQQQQRHQTSQEPAPRPERSVEERRGGETHVGTGTRGRLSGDGRPAGVGNSVKEPRQRWRNEPYSMNNTTVTHGLTTGTAHREHYSEGSSLGAKSNRELCNAEPGTESRRNWSSNSGSTGRTSACSRPGNAIFSPTRGTSTGDTSNQDMIVPGKRGGEQQCGFSKQEAAAKHANKTHIKKFETRSTCNDSRNCNRPSHNNPAQRVIPGATFLRQETLVRQDSEAATTAIPVVVCNSHKHDYDHNPSIPKYSSSAATCSSYSSQHHLRYQHTAAGPALSSSSSLSLSSSSSSSLNHNNSNKENMTLLQYRPRASGAAFASTSTSASTSSRNPHPQEQQPAPASKSKPQQRIWKSAVDPKSGRTYYYDVVTRETQWRKPIELATPEERAAMAAKERKQREFFMAMEANILSSLANGSVPGTPRAGRCDEDDLVGPLHLPEKGLRERSKGANPSASTGKGTAIAAATTTTTSATKPSASLEKPKMIRTISSMDDTLLAELTKVESGGGERPDDKNKKHKKATSAAPTVLSSSRATGPSPTSVTAANSNVSPFNNSSSSSSSISGKNLFGATASSIDSRGSNINSDIVESEEEANRAIERIRQVADEMTRASQITTATAASISLTATTVNSTTTSSNSNETSPTTTKAEPQPGTSSALTHRELKYLAKPNLAKRNTCGTLYVGSTMSAPDKDATIKCVCGVFRAHMLQSAREESNTILQHQKVKFDEYEIFNDHPLARRTSSLVKQSSFDRKHKNSQTSSSSSSSSSCVYIDHRSSQNSIEALSLESAETAVPSLDDITNFYRDVFRKSQMEADCIIMSIIYVERLIKVTNGGVRPRASNWRSILFASMILSSKVWDDLSMWNADFSQTCPAGVTFSLQRINELELAMLGCLKYDVKVPASEYAKYYFLLRSMLIRSGLAGDDIASMSPLDVEGAKKLEHVSANFQANAALKAEVSKLNSRRSKSVGMVEGEILRRHASGLSDDGSLSSSGAEGGSASGSPKLCGGGSPKTLVALKVSLEQVVQM